MSIVEWPDHRPIGTWHGPIRTTHPRLCELCYKGADDGYLQWGIQPGENHWYLHGTGFVCNACRKGREETP